MAIIALCALYLTFKFGGEQTLIGNQQVELGKQQITLAQHAQQIQGFDTLIKSSFAQIDSLSKVISILNAQLSSSERVKKEANHNFEVIRLADINKLNSAVQSILTLEYSHYQIPLPSTENYDSLIMYDRDRTEFMHTVGNILKSQQDNPFLLENDTMSNNWINCMNRAISYPHKFQSDKIEVYFGEPPSGTFEEIERKMLDISRHVAVWTKKEITVEKVKLSRYTNTKL